MFNIQQSKDVQAKKQQTNPVFFQPKLTVNQPNDIHEQEADVMADTVVRMSDPSVNQNSFFKPAVTPVQRKCSDCEKEDNKLHRKENSAEAPQAGNGLDNYVASLGSSGQPMPDASRQFFEPRFGRDFSDVRIHTDAGASNSAQSINALAYTTGNNIVFNEGQYAPDSEQGKKLIAHELTHVVQQGNHVAREVVQRTPGVDAQDSWNAIMNLSIGQDVTTDAADKTTRRDEAVKRMLSTRSGSGLINKLWTIACANKKACGKINAVFTDDLKRCPEAAGCALPSPLSANAFPYTVLVGNVVPVKTRSKTLFSTWGAGPNAVTWHHTDPESAMANTLFHELLHILFINDPNHDKNMPTGHGDAEKGEIDPNFSFFMQRYNNQLDAKEKEIHNNP